MGGEKQKDLFNNEVKEDYEKHWQDMPEFIQKDISSFKQLIVNFKKIEDYKLFQRIIKQKLTLETKSIWFPSEERDKPSNYLYFYIEK